MGFFSSIGKVFGLGSKSSGGTRDAFREFEKFTNSIQPLIDQRQSQLAGQGLNSFIGDLRSPFQNAIQQNEALGTQIQGLQGRADGISGLLRSSALSNTQGAQSDAIRAARLASGGRGGLGFGGGAGAIAARAAQGASSQQSAALSNALLQGEQFKLGFDQQALGLAQRNSQLGGQLAQGLTSAISGQASLEETFRAREDQLQNTNIQGRLGLAGAALGGGLKGRQQLAGRKTNFFGDILGGFGNFASAKAGVPVG